MKKRNLQFSFKIFYALLLLLALSALIITKAQSNDKYLFHDSHFHITNYVQEGIEMEFYVDSIMGDKVGRSTVFGLPVAAAMVISCNRGKCTDILSRYRCTVVLLLILRCMDCNAIQIPSERKTGTT